MGKILEDVLDLIREGKHPHGCGEDWLHLQSKEHCSETPPRVWGRSPFWDTATDTVRNTPTGVGKIGAKVTIGSNV